MRNIHRKIFWIRKKLWKVFSSFQQGLKIRNLNEACRYVCVLTIQRIFMEMRHAQRHQQTAFPVCCQHKINNCLAWKPNFFCFFCWHYKYPRFSLFITIIFGKKGADWLRNWLRQNGCRHAAVNQVFSAVKCMHGGLTGILSIFKSAVFSCWIHGGLTGYFCSF